MKTDSIRAIFILLALFSTTLIGGQLAARTLAVPQQPSEQPVVLVRILELSAIGPNGVRRTLYRSEEGYTTTLDGLGRIGSQVSAAGLADGAYHTLSVRLHDSYQRIRPDGARESGRFSEQGKPVQLRIRGMIKVEDGSATPLRMLDTPSYYGYPEGYRGEEEDD